MISFTKDLTLSMELSEILTVFIGIKSSLTSDFLFALDVYKRQAFEQGGGGAGGFGGFGGFNGADMGDIFGDIFGDLFGGGGRRRPNNGPMKGANVRAAVHITFEEAVFGCEKELELNLKDTCNTCHGTGAKPVSYTHLDVYKRQSCDRGADG